MPEIATDLPASCAVAARGALLSAMFHAPIPRAPRCRNERKDIGIRVMTPTDTDRAVPLLKTLPHRWGRVGWGDGPGARHCR